MYKNTIVLILTMNQISTCNVSEISCSDELTVFDSAVLQSFLACCLMKVDSILQSFHIHRPQAATDGLWFCQNLCMEGSYKYLVGHMFQWLAEEPTHMKSQPTSSWVESALVGLKLRQKQI